MKRSIGCLVLVSLFLGCDDPGSTAGKGGPQAAEGPPFKPLEEKKTEMTKSGLKMEDVKVGEGTEAKSGNVVSVHYTGWLTNGKKFDSSLDRGRPFSIILGAGKVIKGWDEGLVGMKEGGKRRLEIPP